MRRDPTIQTVNERIRSKYPGALLTALNGEQAAQQLPPAIAREQPAANLVPPWRRQQQPQAVIDDPNVPPWQRTPPPSTPGADLEAMYGPGPWSQTTTVAARGNAPPLDGIPQIDITTPEAKAFATMHIPGYADPDAPPSKRGRQPTLTEQYGLGPWTAGEQAAAERAAQPPDPNQPPWDAELRRIAQSADNTTPSARAFARQHIPGYAQQDPEPEAAQQIVDLRLPPWQRVPEQMITKGKAEIFLCKSRRTQWKGEFEVRTKSELGGCPRKQGSAMGEISRVRLEARTVPAVAIAEKPSASQAVRR
jgi:hypothetical protein